MTKPNWTLKIQIEDDHELLKELSRGVIRSTNVEYFLREVIKPLSKKCPHEDATLGKLLRVGKKYLSDDLFAKLDKLNRKRKEIIHGVIGTKGGTNDNFIQKEGQEIKLDVSFLKWYSDLAMEILQDLMTILQSGNLKSMHT